MAKTSAPVQTTRTAPTPVSIYEDLLRRGFTKEQSAEQVAQLCGLQTTHLTQPLGWTIEEITRLLFVAHRVGKETKKP